LSSRARAKKGFSDERPTLLVLDLDEDPFVIAVASANMSTSACVTSISSEQPSS
jgi:hypothetical protein